MNIIDGRNINIQFNPNDRFSKSNINIGKTVTKNEISINTIKVINVFFSFHFNLYKNKNIFSTILKIKKNRHIIFFLKKEMIYSKYEVCRTYN